MVLVILIIGLLAIRAFETYLFIKKVSKVCYKYDWKVINKNPELLLVKMGNKDYHLTSGWSAYNFMYLNGPSPILIFLSFKNLTIDNLYNKEVISRLNEYEII